MTVLKNGNDVRASDGDRIIARSVWGIEPRMMFVHFLGGVLMKGETSLSRLGFGSLEKPWGSSSILCTFYSIPNPSFLLSFAGMLSCFPSFFAPLYLSTTAQITDCVFVIGMWGIESETMPKNKGKGGKNRKRGKNEAVVEKRELIFKEEGQEYAQVLRMLGNGRCDAMCIDGTKRLCHIRGKMHRKVWIDAGDIILVGLRDYQDHKADVILKYWTYEARLLKAYGELPANTRINVGIAGGFDEEDDGDAAAAAGDDDDYIEFMNAGTSSARINFI
ncbi:hypothetical protein D5086_004271 [Populus alba]|uniref:Uncharacterized protein n=1 Tax=Populus alba TaxID=43335 RepID=A0ACC4CQA5_POPAL